jgi:anti-sigma factor RsiW
MGWQLNRQSNALSAEMLDHHLETLSSGAPPNVLSSDRHTVKPWFQGKLPFSFNLPEVLPADTVLKGADLTYLSGEPVAQLLFSIHKHDVSIFLTQRQSRIPLAAMPSVRSRFSMRSAATPAMNLVAVSDVNPAELEMILQALVAAQFPH